MTDLGLSYKQICQSSLVRALSLLPHCLVLFFASGSEARVEAERTQSEGRAKAEWRHSVKTNPRLATSRPFSNAKIARNNDMANFFEQKMSLFPLLKKRGSLWYQKRLSLTTRKRGLSRRKTCFLYFSRRKKWTYHKLFYAQQLKNTQNT